MNSMRNYIYWVSVSKCSFSISSEIVHNSSQEIHFFHISAWIAIECIWNSLSSLSNQFSTMRYYFKYFSVILFSKLFITKPSWWWNNVNFINNFHFDCNVVIWNIWYYLHIVQYLHSNLHYNVEIIFNYFNEWSLWTKLVFHL